MLIDMKFTGVKKRRSKEVVPSQSLLTDFYSLEKGDSHPPISCGNSKANIGVFPHKKRRVPHEEISNPMRVAAGGVGRPVKVYVHPHNYRRYFRFDPSGFHARQPHSTLLEKYGLFGEWRVVKKNYGAEWHIENFNFCRVVVRRRSVEIIVNHPDFNRHRLIVGESRAVIDARIEEISRGLVEHCLSTLHKVLKVFGGKSDFVDVTKREPEVAIHGVDVLDRIPKELIFTDTVGKKVYEDKFEAYGLANTKNIIANYALHDFAPELSESLDALRESVGDFDRKLEGLVEVARATAEVNKGTADLLQQEIKLRGSHREGSVEKDVVLPEEADYFG